MAYVWMAIVGFLAGLLARAILPGDQKIGMILTSVLGIAGSFVANFVGQALGFYKAGANAGFIASVIGAIIVLAVYSFVTKKSGSDSGPTV